MSLSELPTPIQTVLCAVQAGDGAALRVALGKAPYLIEEGLEYRGDGIAGWLDGLVLRGAETARPINNEAKRGGETVVTILAAEREIIDREFTMYVLDVIEHYGHVIVTANVNGNFDWRGLPDSLVLAFHFSSSCGRILQLIILRNQSGT